MPFVEKLFSNLEIFQFTGCSHESREIPDEFDNRVEKFIKKQAMV